MEGKKKAISLLEEKMEERRKIDAETGQPSSNGLQYPTASYMPNIIGMNNMNNMNNMPTLPMMNFQQMQLPIT